MLLLSTSCVHEWPENDHPKRDITLNVHHLLGWTELEYLVTRDDSQKLPLARYHFKVFPAGTSEVPVAEFQFSRDDLSRADFSTTIGLSEGDYDLYAWSDYADAGKLTSYFFKTDDFKNIVYGEPYNGNNELRDAFRGKCSFTVESSIMADYHQDVELNLERPFARYEFRATDILEFIDREVTRGELSRGAEPHGSSPSDLINRLPELNRYRVKMIYTGYMPSKFDNIQNRPVDSSTGMSYDAKIELISDEEARLGFDYVMVNGHESSVAVGLELYNPDGELIGRVSTINVPTKRGQNTIVRGRFLTSQATGGVGIDPGFNGDYNIEIR